jgi:hypothetical protein
MGRFGHALWVVPEDENNAFYGILRLLQQRFDFPAEGLSAYHEGMISF